MKCLKCEVELDDFTSVTRGVIPKAGDVSVCAYCSNIAIYTGNLMDMREATPEELTEVAVDSATQDAIAITKLYQALKNIT